MTIDNATYHHNHMTCPTTGMLAPIDLLLKTQVSCTHCQDMHFWGCLCYVLDPKLQDGPKCPNENCTHAEESLLV